MSTHNNFLWELAKYQFFSVEKSILSRAMLFQNGCPRYEVLYLFRIKVTHSVKLNKKAELYFFNVKLNSYY